MVALRPIGSGQRLLRLQSQGAKSVSTIGQTAGGFASCGATPFTGSNSLPSESLNKRYLSCFGARAKNAVALPGAVRDLICQDVCRQTLLTSAGQAGCAKATVSSLLSRIFVSSGHKPSATLLELLGHARGRYGVNFLKVLRAVLRASKAEFAPPPCPETRHLRWYFVHAIAETMLLLQLRNKRNWGEDFSCQIRLFGGFSIRLIV